MAWDRGLSTEEYQARARERVERGIDGDLEACLENNPQKEFSLSDIERVLAVFEGQNDEEDWAWVLRMKDGRYFYLEGWCDYTGWDCRSGAFCNLFDIPMDAALSASKDYIRESLVRQINNIKNVTWREAKDKEFGLS
jgi:hypothetical protein